MGPHDIERLIHWVGMAPWLAGWWTGRRGRGWLWALVLATAGIASCLFAADGVLRPYAPLTNQPYLDMDQRLIVAEVRCVPSLVETGKWWSGTWIPNVPFWRPVSISLFWMEWKLFGDHFARWSVVSTLLAVGLAAVMLWALIPLFGEAKAAAATLATVAALLVPWYRFPPLELVVALWKNQPDLLAGLGVFGAVGFAVRSRFLLSALCCAFAIASKEIGFTAVALVPLCLGWQAVVQGQRPDWRRAAAAFLVPGLLLGAWHYHAVGIGMRLGPNHFWVRRALLYYGGFPAPMALGTDWWIPASSALYVACGVRLRARLLLLLLAILAATAAVVGLMVWQNAQPWDGALALLWVVPAHNAAMVLWFVSAYLVWLRARPVALLGLAWMLIGAAPTFAGGQVQMHAQWLGSAGQGILAAGVIGAWWDVARASAVGALARLSKANAA